jgi:methyl-accepting chemotaxis protein
MPIALPSPLSPLPEEPLRSQFVLLRSLGALVAMLLVGAGIVWGLAPSLVPVLLKYPIFQSLGAAPLTALVALLAFVPLAVLATSPFWTAELRDLSRKWMRQSQALRLLTAKVANHDEKKKFLAEEALQMALYLSLVNKQLDGALSDSETSVTAVIECLTNVHEVSSKQTGRIDNSITDCQHLTEAIHEQTVQNKRVVNIMNVMTTQISELIPLVDLIARISKQTTLIAINAAIESARAGVAGLSFAVVSEEVKMLSKQTSLAATSIEETLLKATRDASAELTTTVKANTGLQETLNLDEIITRLDSMEQRFTGTLSLLMEVTSAVKEANEHALQEFSKAFGHMQFQDIFRQRLAHVQAGLRDLDSHFTALAADQRVDYFDEKAITSLKERMAKHFEGYVMHSQRDTHANVVGTEDALPASNSLPAIELF